MGTVLNVIQAGVGWFGEGDDLFYVDGAAHPRFRRFTEPERRIISAMRGGYASTPDLGPVRRLPKAS